MCVCVTERERRVSEGAIERECESEREKECVGEIVFVCLTPYSKTMGKQLRKFQKASSRIESVGRTILPLLATVFREVFI